MTRTQLSVLLGGAAIALGVPPAALATSCPTGQQTFTSTGSEQCYTVPAGVTTLNVVAVGGAGGGSLGGHGGAGAQVTADVAVTPGSTLYVEVGLGGAPASVTAGAGGGASGVQTCSSSTCSLASDDTRLVVAGGGGGAGASGAGGDGGAGGIGGSGASITCQPGADGTPGQSGANGNGGAGGTCSAGGDGGTGGFSGTAGTLGTGGAGGAGNEVPGGGGGGGFYGGGGGGSSVGNGGGNGGGGGGGSSFGPAGSTFALGNGTPSVSITPLAAAVSLSAPTLTFPKAQPLGTVSTPRHETITNNGTAPLQVNGLTFGGANPAAFLIASNGCLGPIAPTSSCTVGVDFAPHMPGPRTATLVIASNDPASPATVQLSGTGGRISSSTALSLSKGTATFGSEQLEHFSATVSSQTTGTPTGKVAIRSGTLTLCTITLASGHGSCSPSATALPAGQHTITANYTGNNTYKPSQTSKTLTVSS